jgi:hypothetical protein
VLAMIISYDGRPLGYVQRFFPRDELDFWGT